MSTRTARTTTPPSLAHLVIFNPTLRPCQTPPPSAPQTPSATVQVAPEPEPTERDKDLEDDLREAAQIAFYTSRQSTSVSRDTMLKQTGLVKGLTGFADMIARDPSSSFTSISSSKSRMLVWSPESDWYIYVNVALATTTTEDAKVEPSATAQGISDYTLVSALARGYEDFRLLHGPLSSLLPLSPASSSLLDKYWTRFALHFEDAYILPSPTITSAIGTPSAPSQQTSHAVARAVEVFREDTDLDPGSDTGVLNVDGVIYSSIEDPALSRYLSTLVAASLPPAPVVPVPDARQSLGFGLHHSRADRKKSWNIGSIGSMGSLGFASFLPGLPSRSASPSVASLRKESGASGRLSDQTDLREGKASKPRWSFGVPTLGIGDAMGSVGGVFGLGQSPKTAEQGGAPAEEAGEASETEGTEVTDPSPTEDAQPADKDDGSERELADSTEQEPQTAVEAPVCSDKSSRIGEEITGDEIASQVSQSVFDPSDLRDAIEPEDEVFAGWENRSVWVSNGKDQVPRRLTYIIRDNVLLYILLPDTAEETSHPPSQAVLSLYSKLFSILGSTGPSSPDTVKLTHGNSTLLLQDGGVEQSGPAIEAAPSASLSQLRDILRSDGGIHEVYARTHASRFVLGQRLRQIHPASEDVEGTEEEHVGDAELYMLVGQKDASLTDAEHAVRGFLRGKTLAVV